MMFYKYVMLITFFFLNSFTCLMKVTLPVSFLKKLLNYLNPAILFGLFINYPPTCRYICLLSVQCDNTYQKHSNLMAFLLLLTLFCLSWCSPNLCVAIFPLSLRFQFKCHHFKEIILFYNTWFWFNYLLSAFMSYWYIFKYLYLGSLGG